MLTFYRRWGDSPTVTGKEGGGTQPSQQLDDLSERRAEGGVGEKLDEHMMAGVEMRECDQAARMEGMDLSDVNDVNNSKYRFLKAAGEEEGGVGDGDGKGLGTMQMAGHSQRVR